jgi:hypothetical protein
MDQAAFFLASSILISITSIVLAGAILIINNLVAKYWKSWGWKIVPFDDTNVRYITKEDAEKVRAAKEQEAKAK